MLDPVALHVDLQGQQQSEEELVLLVEAACRVLVHLKGHELDNVADAFAGDWAFGGPVEAAGTTVTASKSMQCLTILAIGTDFSFN